MTDELSIVIGVLFLIVTLMSGMQVFVAIGLSGAVGTLMLAGAADLMRVGDLLFDSIWKVALLATPGFILMGAVFFEHGFGRDLFVAARAWLGRLRGGLLLSSVWLGALFGFICGSNMAGVATIGKIAIPEVERHGYDRGLSLGAFAIAGTLSVLIPPSLLMIIYAVLAETSLGDLFFAGMVPGIILAVLLCGYIVLQATVTPEKCPPTDPVPLAEKLRSLIGILPVIVTFAVVFGGIYLGVWSVVEASAVSAAMAILFAIGYRRFSWRAFGLALDATLRILVMVYMIIICATLLNHFIVISKIDEGLTELVSGLDAPRWVVMFFILLILTIMGCIFDLYALMLISISVFLPIAINLGYDKVWFGIVLIIACELALVTPPVGINLFVIKNLAPPDTKSTEIALGAIPYVFVVWILFVLLVAFPELALWLPKSLK